MFTRRQSATPSYAGFTHARDAAAARRALHHHAVEWTEREKDTMRRGRGEKTERNYETRGRRGEERGGREGERDIAKER